MCRSTPRSCAPTNTPPARAITPTANANHPAPSPPTTDWAAPRGGLSTKIHLACEQGRKPLSIVLTAGQAGDSPQFSTVLDAIRVARTGPGRPGTRPDRVLADKAYSSRANRAYLRRRRIAPTIPQPSDQIRNRRRRGRAGGRPPTFCHETYKQRHAVECGINQYKQHRAVASRHDKLAGHYEATIHVATIDTWIRDLSNRLWRSAERAAACGCSGQVG